jgi:hypothetical protein
LLAGAAAIICPNPAVWAPGTFDAFALIDNQFGQSSADNCHYHCQEQNITQHYTASFSLFTLD